MCDKQIEELYKELEDVIFDEDEELGMVLADDWKEWKKGAERLTIWEWFDSYHSKGLGIQYVNADAEPRTTMTLSMSVDDKMALKMIATKRKKTVSKMLHDWIVELQQEEGEN